MHAVIFFGYLNCYMPCFAWKRWLLCCLCLVFVISQLLSEVQWMLPITAWEPPWSPWPHSLFSLAFRNITSPDVSHSLPEALRQRPWAAATWLNTSLTLGFFLIFSCSGCWANMSGCLGHHQGVSQTPEDLVSVISPKWNSPRWKTSCCLWGHLLTKNHLNEPLKASTF